MKLSHDIAVRARGGKAFRVPRLGDNDVNDNPTIDPEEFYHAEFGVNKRFANGGEFDITGWWMGGENLIVKNGFGGSVF